MKKKQFQLFLIGGMLITMNVSVNAQWSRNAPTTSVFLTHTTDKVGIGISAPAYILDVRNTTGDATMSLKSNNATAKLIINRGGSARTAGVSYRLLGSEQWLTGCVNNDNFQVTNSSPLGLALVIQSTTNNVGIGTQSPVAKLDIAGNIKIADGTQGAGKVLTSDASGKATWQPLISAWKLTGNAGTNPAVNFIGTTDNVALSFRVNNQKAGAIDPVIFNTSFGYQTFNSNTTGGGNTAIGASALFHNTIGADNCAFGEGTMFTNISGNYNTAIGTSSLNSCSSGSYNTACGNGALLADLTGSYNTALGTFALTFNTGDGNTALGSNSLYSNTTGSSNTAIGTSADVSSGNLTNATVIGSNAIVSTSNTISLGNGLVTSWAFGLATTGSGKALQVGSYPANGNGAYLSTGGAWTNGSSENIKENFVKLNGEDILSKINQLNIPSWDYKGTPIPEKHIGPMSQQFYELFGTGLEGDREHISTIDPAGVALIGIQQLTKKSDDKDLIIAEQQKQIDELKKKMELFEKALSQCCANFSDEKQSAALSTDKASLQQNTPNPFNQSTTIKYYLPVDAKNAHIIVYNQSGIMLKDFVLDGAGFGELKIDAGSLSAGVYNYCLEIDGKKVDTRQMILTK